MWINQRHALTTQQHLMPYLRWRLLLFAHVNFQLYRNTKEIHTVQHAIVSLPCLMPLFANNSRIYRLLNFSAPLNEIIWFALICISICSLYDDLDSQNHFEVRTRNTEKGSDAMNIIDFRASLEPVANV